MPLGEESYDLRALAGTLTQAFPQIEAPYLFGSRRFQEAGLDISTFD